jgi:hypothetical protein
LSGSNSYWSVASVDTENLNNHSEKIFCDQKPTLKTIQKQKSIWKIRLRSQFHIKFNIIMIPSTFKENSIKIS